MIRISEVGNPWLKAFDVALGLERHTTRLAFTINRPTTLSIGSRLLVEAYGPESQPRWLRWLRLALRRRVYAKEFVLVTARYGPATVDCEAIDRRSFDRSMRYDPEW